MPLVADDDKRIYSPYLATIHQINPALEYKRCVDESVAKDMDRVAAEMICARVYAPEKPFVDRYESELAIGAVAGGIVVAAFAIYFGTKAAVSLGRRHSGNWRETSLWAAAIGSLMSLTTILIASSIDSIVPLISALSALLVSSLTALLVISKKNS